MITRLGIIGCGRIANRAVKELQFVKEIEITAVMNPNRKSAVAFASAHGITGVTGDIGTLAEMVDAVYIASPHGTHYEYAMELLTAGIGVLCEKPMAFSRQEVIKLYDIAATQNLVIMEAIKTAYCPGFRKIEEVVSSGVIGEIVDVEAGFTRLTAIGGREYADQKYGGALTEFGSYGMLPVFRFLGTDYKGVHFLSRRTEEVDGYTKAVLEYDDRFASVKAGLSAKSEGQLLISGTKGYLLAPSPWWLTRYFEVRYEDAGIIDRYETEFDGDGLRYEFIEFARRICNGEPGPAKERDEAIARADIFERFLACRNKDSGKG